jgi:hypothetical protein
MRGLAECRSSGNVKFEFSRFLAEADTRTYEGMCRMWCYGETAASRMLHPNRLLRNTHAGLGFVSYDPRSGQ